MKSKKRPTCVKVGGNNSWGVYKTLLIVIGLPIILSTICTMVFLKIMKPTDRTRFKSLQALEKRYIEIHQNDEVWFTVNTPTESSLARDSHAAVRRGEKIRDLLSESQHVSDDTRMIWNNFKGFIPTIQIGEVSGHLVTATTNEARSLYGIDHGKEIAFIPRSLAVKDIQLGDIKKLLCWRSDMGVSIMDIKWAPKFLTGVLYHELFHGLQHPVNSKGFFSPESDEYALEEMKAHKIESDVLNSLTEGEYFKKFDSIIARQGSGAHVKDIVASISIDDMKSFDKMLGMEDSGMLSAGLAFPQHVLGLAKYTLDRRGASEKECLEFFRWMALGEVITY